MNQTATTVRPAAESDVDAIARILASAFAGLFRAEFGLRQAEVTSLLADLYHVGALPLDKVRVAVRNQTVVGVAVLSVRRPRPGERPLAWVRAAWPVFRKRMGWRGAARAAIGSVLLRYYFAGRTPIAGEAYVDSLAVEESYRRQGVGRALLEDACGVAQRKGCREIALHVLHARTEARRLYESCGFAVEPERRILSQFADAATAGLERITRRDASNERSVLMVRRLKTETGEHESPPVSSCD
jgi:ribosomal protein S18 acetylase RimI-like enzyme